MALAKDDFDFWNSVIWSFCVFLQIIYIIIGIYWTVQLWRYQNNLILQKRYIRVALVEIVYCLGWLVSVTGSSIFHIDQNNEGEAVFHLAQLPFAFGILYVMIWRFWMISYDMKWIQASLNEQWHNIITNPKYCYTINLSRSHGNSKHKSSNNNNNNNSNSNGNNDLNNKNSNNNINSNRIPRFTASVVTIRNQFNSENGIKYNNNENWYLTNKMTLGNVDYIGKNYIYPAIIINPIIVWILSIEFGTYDIISEIVYPILCIIPALSIGYLYYIINKMKFEDNFFVYKEIGTIFKLLVSCIIVYTVIVLFVYFLLTLSNVYFPLSLYPRRLLSTGILSFVYFYVQTCVFGVILFHTNWILTKVKTVVRLKRKNQFDFQDCCNCCCDMVIDSCCLQYCNICGICEKWYYLDCFCSDQIEYLIPSSMNIRYGNNNITRMKTSTISNNITTTKKNQNKINSINTNNREISSTDTTIKEKKNGLNRNKKTKASKKDSMVSSTSTAFDAQALENATLPLMALNDENDDNSDSSGDSDNDNVSIASGSTGRYKNGKRKKKTSLSSHIRQQSSKMFKLSFIESQTMRDSLISPMSEDGNMNGNENGNGRKVCLSQILSHGKAFDMFMNHLCHEFSMECLLSLVEFIQFQDYIYNIVIEKDCFGLIKDEIINANNVKINWKDKLISHRLRINLPLTIPQSCIVFNNFDTYNLDRMFSDFNDNDNNNNDDIYYSDQMKENFNNFIELTKIKAYLLFKKYIATESEFEININYRMRQKLVKLMRDFDSWMQDDIEIANLDMYSKKISRLGSVLVESDSDSDSDDDNDNKDNKDKKDKKQRKMNGKKLQSLFELFVLSSKEMYRLLRDSFRRFQKTHKFTKLTNLMFVNKVDHD